MSLAIALTPELRKDPRCFMVWSLTLGLFAPEDFELDCPLDREIQWAAIAERDTVGLWPCPDLEPVLTRLRAIDPNVPWGRHIAQKIAAYEDALGRAVRFGTLFAIEATMKTRLASIQAAAKRVVEAGEEFDSTAEVAERIARLLSSEVV